MCLAVLVDVVRRLQFALLSGVGGGRALRRCCDGHGVGSSIDWLLLVHDVDAARIFIFLHHIASEVAAATVDWHWRAVIALATAAARLDWSRWASGTVRA